MLGPSRSSPRFESSVRSYALADSMVPAAIGVVSDDVFSEASEQRRLGQLDHARATAARLMTIALRLVREYPASAHSYRVLMCAHDQAKKNAFETHDDEVILASLVQAVDAGQRSLALEPDRLETQRHLNTLTGQLASIRAERKAASPSLSLAPGK